MKAALFHEYGPPEVLKYEDIDPLPVGPHDAMVKVRATSVNRFDILCRKGAYKPNKVSPHILGGDIAGEVEEVGAEATHVRAGDRVVVYGTLGCGVCESCLRGEPNGCVRFEYFGAARWGGYAQFWTGPARNLVRLGDRTEFADCAALNITGKRGVDVVFEHVGADTWADSVRSLTRLGRLGRLVTCGGSSGYNVTASVAHIFHKQLTLIGSNMGTPREMATVVKLLEEGELKTVIDRKLPLREAAQAHEIVESRDHFGKVIPEPEH